MVIYLKHTDLHSKVVTRLADYYNNTRQTEFIPTLQTAHCVSIINTSPLILYRVIISVYWEPYTFETQNSRHILRYSTWVRQSYVSKVKVKASPLDAEQTEGEGRGTALPPFDPGVN